MTDNIQSILDDKKRSLIEVYLELQQIFEEKYGENTVVVMEVGSFFEVYGVDNERQKIGKPKEIAEVLNLQLTRKNKSIAHNDVKNPLLAGFPLATFDRYMQRLIQEEKYTIVLVRQKGTPPNVSRYVDRIISPGVNFDYSLDHDDNYIASLIVEQHSGVYSVGYAALDVTTGKTYLQEIHSTKEDETFALDEACRLLQSYHTAEVLLTTSKDCDDTYIEEYLELTEKDVKYNKKRLNVTYQNELFKQTYIIKSFLSPIEFLDLEKQPVTSEALGLLIEFIIDHDFKIIQKLEKPKLLQTSTYLYLGNNPLEQLNILSRDPKDLTVLKLIDHTATSIGRRLLKERLLNPITNKEELEARYNLSDIFHDTYPKIDQELRSVYDLERIIRRIKLARLHPFELNFLYDSLTAAERILDHIEHIDSHRVIHDFLEERHALKNCITTLETVFHFDETGKVSMNTIDTSLFQKGFDTELDDLLSKKQSLEQKLEAIREKIVDVLHTETGKDESNFVVIKQLDKEGHHITMTKSRYSLIESKIKKEFISLDGDVHAFSDFGYKVQTTNVKITADVIDDISENIVALQSRIVALTKELYLKELAALDERFSSILQRTSSFLAKIDVAISNLKASLKLNLTRPKIIDQENAFLEIVDLRHPLIESREETGIYVPNDILLGDRSQAKHECLLNGMNSNDTHGVLLYGINSSGKSSLMKSMGIAVMLAQSGFYVPASSMRFVLFQELFTRILAKDNFEKGLSSFGVEMMELKNIFNRCSPRSLILGDEISHGTETMSAIAIVSATIEQLAAKQALFFFTTHLHQLNNLKRIRNIKNLVSVHLAVNYDPDADKLIFERKLQEGSGSSIYGLEFAQSLHIDKGFMKKAMQIRKELAGEFEDLELLTKKQTSKYNKDVYLTSCAICKDAVDDTHHIAPQHTADADGRIGHFHKDHKFNLLPLCKSCHNDVHDGTLVINGFVMTSEGLEINYMRRENQKTE